MRVPLVAANWKMNKTVGEALHFIELFMEGWGEVTGVEVIIAPPFTALLPVRHTIGQKKIGLAGQNLFWEEKGAYTGEVSPGMLKDVGCTHVIIGHSERRKYFGESDETVNRKTRAALREGLVPIMCIGESLEQRERGETLQIIEGQVKNGLQGLNKDELADIIIAYEPIWAIGTGMNATPQQAQEVHAHIRSLVSDMWEDELASRARILYGGSVNPDNSHQLMREADIDGALVGGASLKPDAFREIVISTAKAKEV
jgi:triosephosphate isomerase